MRSQVARKFLSATEARNLRTLLLLNVFEPQEIGDRIKRARERAGLTQEELGDLIGVSTRQVQNYEAGESKQYSRLKQIAAVVGTTPEALLHGDDAATTGASPGQLEEVLAAVEATRGDVRRLQQLVVTAHKKSAPPEPGRRLRRGGGSPRREGGA
jgi:transcriptional regulator with XRE-family HTH domain